MKSNNSKIDKLELNLLEENSRHLNNLNNLKNLVIPKKKEYETNNNDPKCLNNDICETCKCYKLFSKNIVFKNSLKQCSCGKKNFEVDSHGNVIVGGDLFVDGTIYNDDIIGTTGPTGPQGLQGPTGPTGLQGLQGETGSQGLQGLQGETGPQGFQGIQGATGPQGLQGETGPQGLQGLQGETGPQGLQGIQGETGPQGLQGLQGETGPQGLQGETGPQGLQGETGPQGLQGETGPQGLQGIQGETGPQGLQGETGPQGLQGIQGETGPQGIQGETGPQGLQGETGPQGPTGLQGTSGISSGLVFYLDGTTNTINPPYTPTINDTLLVIPNTTTQQILTINSIPLTPSLIANYVSQPGVLLTTIIIPGLWTTTLFAQRTTGGPGNILSYYIVINEVASDGTTIIGNIASGSSSSGTFINLTQTAYLYQLYVPDAYVLQSLNSRIQVQVWVTSFSGTPNLIIEMRDSTLSNIVTTIATNLVGPTGPQGFTGPQGLQGDTGPSSSGTNVYGSFYDTTTQTVLGVNTATVLQYNTTLYSQGISITGSPPTRITVAEAGVYEIAYSIQFDQTGGSVHTATIWARINGSDVIDSASQIAINGQNGETLPFVSYIFTLSAGQYVEFVFSATDANVSATYFPAIPPAPAIPSIIIQAKKIATDIGLFNNIPSGTGSILLYQSLGPTGSNLFYSSNLQVFNTGPTGTVLVSGNVVPSQDNIYSLGLTGSVWKDLYVGTGSVYLGTVKTSSSIITALTGPTGPAFFTNSHVCPDMNLIYSLGSNNYRWADMWVGPGTINIAGPGDSNATIGTNAQGTVYTQDGFASPFINVGPEINTNEEIGGWRISATGSSTGPNYDLIAQQNTLAGLTGPVYSLLHPNGLTGPTGPQGSNGSSGPTGPQGPQGSNGSSGPTGPQGSNGSSGPTGPQGQQGSSSGLVLFLNNSNYPLNKNAPDTAGVLLTSPANNTTPQTYISYTFTNNDNTAHLIGTFTYSFINSLVVPAGIWDLNVYTQLNQTSQMTYIYMKIYYVNGVTSTLIADGTTNTTAININTAITLYTNSLYVPLTTLPNTTCSIKVEVYVQQPTGSTNGKIFHLYMNDNTISHIHTTLSVPTVYTEYTLSPLLTGPTGYGIGSGGLSIYDYYQFDTTSGAVTINMPTITSGYKRVFNLSDAVGNAGTNNITIQASGGNTISGTGTNVITTNYGSVKLVSDCNNKWLKY